MLYRKVVGEVIYSKIIDFWGSMQLLTEYINIKHHENN